MNQGLQEQDILEDGDHVEGEVEGEVEHRVTRSMSKNRALEAMMAMVSIVKLLKTKKEKAQEMGGSEVDNEAFEEARQKELQSFIETGTYTEVDDSGQNVISMRWVYTYKSLPDGGEKPKARLVARGFEDRDIHQIDMSSPTCNCVL